MSRKLLLLSFVLLAVVGGLFLRKSRRADLPAALPEPGQSLPQVVMTGPHSPMPPASTTVAEPAPKPEDMPSAQNETAEVKAMSVEQRMEKVSATFEDFRRSVGENPVGSNAEMVRSLTGENEKHIRLPIPAGSSVNGEGELVDQWGTPYFFHQQSKSEMEIRSAGPDRKLWTEDDAVTR